MSLSILTPESVDLSLEPAGIGSRFFASLIDGLIQGGIILVISLVAGLSIDFLQDYRSLSGVTQAILLIAAGFLLLAYKLLLEAFWNGQTVGKRAARIRVVREDGLPVQFSQVLIRNLLRIVDYLPVLYIVGSVATLASKRGQRLGDMVAGTLVVRERRAQALNATVEIYPAHLEIDQTILREYARRLSEADLEAARGFVQRRYQLKPEDRARVAALVADGLAARMGWPDPLPADRMAFIEAVLYVRTY